MSSQSTAPPQHEPEFADIPPKRATVVIWLTVTILLLLSMIGVLLYQGLTRQEPERALVVRANPAWLGAELELTGGEPPQRYLASVDSTGMNTVTFFIRPGRYTLRITAGGKLALDQQIDMTVEGPAILKLPAGGPGTQPTTAELTR